MGDLSEHFDSSEFRDHRTGDVHVHPTLVACLERLRSLEGGRPIRIVSGYRTAATNRAVGGARRSQHLTGRAADIPSHLATVEMARAAGFTGIGVCNGWVVHVDVRPTAGVAVFTDCPHGYWPSERT